MIFPDKFVHDQDKFHGNVFVFFGLFKANDIYFSPASSLLVGHNLKEKFLIFADADLGVAFAGEFAKTIDRLWSHYLRTRIANSLRPLIQANLNRRLGR